MLYMIVLSTRATLNVLGKCDVLLEAMITVLYVNAMCRDVVIANLVGFL